MSVSGICTGGYLGDGGTQVLRVVQETLTGAITETTAISGSISCNGDTMTDIDMVRGDTRNFALAFTYSDLSVVDITGAVIRFAVKRRPRDSNADAVVFKTTIDATQIEIVDAAGGEAVVYLDTEDTIALDPGQYRYDVEVTRPGAAVTPGGTLATTAGSSVLAATGATMASFRIGQVVVVGSTRTVITAVDRSANTITTSDHAWASTASGLAYSLFVGTRSTPDGMRGAFTIAPDVAQ